eukprot:9623027-Heterocapsa_arctica.AAC.1
MATQLRLTMATQTTAIAGRDPFAEQLPPFAVVEALLGHRSAAVDGHCVVLPAGAYKVREKVGEDLQATEMAGATCNARPSGKHRGGGLAGEEGVLDRKCNL